MDKEKVLSYLESSFIGSYLLKENVTDISYNGDSLFYVDNNKGRCKCDFDVEQSVVRDFLRQLANISEKQFSYQNPNLDVSVGRYRVNAVHQSIGRLDNEQVTTFSIRIGSKKLKITEDSDFLTPKLVKLFDCFIEGGISIVIGGVTGSGKTEFQKYLLSRVKDNTRVVVVDNVMELDYLRNNPNLDLTTWQADESNKNASVHNLIRISLRNNPDWLVVAEARGKEMLDVLNSAMTGCPIITTIHSFDAISIPKRMARLVMCNEGKYDFDEVLSDIYHHFRIFVYLAKSAKDDCVKRYISEIYTGDENGNLVQIYSHDKKTQQYKKLSNSLIKLCKSCTNKTFLSKYGV